MTNIIATESIHFQNGEFFKALTEAVRKLRGFGNGLSDKDYFTSKEVGTVLKTIKQYTNLNVQLMEGDPAIYPPYVSKNHVFYDNDQREMMLFWGNAIDQMDSIEKAINRLKKPVLKGTVDLKNARVEGVYADMQMTMMMPRKMLYAAKPFEAEEVAAIMMHEIGHAFTFMEFVSRTLTTNQSLSLLTRSLDKSVPSDKRSIIFSKTAKELKLSTEQTDALMKAKHPEEVSVIIIDKAIEDSISELGGSIYDVNSCEFLADQFAARQGCGRYLVTGLDKLVNSTGYKVISFVAMAIFVIEILVTIYAMPLMSLFWLVALIAMPDKSAQIYDNMSARINRVKLQNIEQLKDPKLSNEVRKHLLEENAAIDAVASNYKDKLGVIEKLAYYIRPGYRKAHKYEMLQKDLEQLASSQLFEAAAKLKLL